MRIRGVSVIAAMTMMWVCGVAVAERVSSGDMRADSAVKVKQKAARGPASHMDSRETTGGGAGFSGMWKPAPRISAQRETWVGPDGHAARLRERARAERGRAAAAHVTRVTGCSSRTG